MPPELIAGPAETLARALDPEVETPDDATSGRILDAALELAGRVGLSRITIDDVAARAGVGRMTVYRRFGGRGGLVESLLVRETRAGLARVGDAVDPGDPVTERVADGFAAALEVGRSHPLLRHLSASAPDALLGMLNAPGDPAGTMIRGFLVDQVRLGPDARKLDDAAAEQAAELLFRIGISFLLLPRSAIDLDDPEAVRSFARTLIAPIIAAGRR